MVGMENLVTKWLHKKDTSEMIDDEIPPPPQIAIVPMPEPTEEERRLKVIADAHVFVAQLGHEREGYRRQIERLESEKIELEDKLKQEERKSGLLELELTQALNNIQTREADFQEKEKCLSLLWQVLTKFNTKLPAKPERKPKKKKAERESATETPKTDG